MTAKSKKVLYRLLMVSGLVLIFSTTGRVDWEDRTPGVNSRDLMPFWQIGLQAGGGLALFFFGLCLEEAAEKTKSEEIEKITAQIKINRGKEGGKNLCE
ncbi:MAG: hypothetical protein AAB792_01865 [Patescibacteria group bacterium]